MSQIRFFTEEQEALIPQLQAKWQAVAFSTERIDQQKATAALNEIYAVMGKTAPEIIFCDSPSAALSRLETYISQVEIPSVSSSQSPEEMLQGLNFAKFFAKAVWGAFQQNNQQKKSEAATVYNLVKELSAQPSKLLGKHLDNAIPQDLTTQEIVEQSFLGASPLFESMGKQQANLGKPDLQEDLQPGSTEWQASFSQTASSIEQQLSWLPAKKFLFRQWLKNFLSGTVSSKITGIEYPKLKETFFSRLSFPQRKFLTENPPIVTSDLAINCISLDFYFSVMNYLYDSNKWQALRNFVKNCGWVFGFNNTCLICDRPTKILLDENRQLHGEGETALEYADGSSYYAYHGIALPEQYGTIHPTQWRSEWVLLEDNRQLKKILLKEIGAVRLCQELSLIEIETIGEYALFSLDENTGTKATYILQRIDPETEEMKAVLIPWHSKNLSSAVNYANKYYSAEDFPLTN